MKAHILSCILALSLTGCATVGPKAIRKAHYPYNQAVVSSWDEQLLLNLVRLRYRDNPYFLEVDGINSTYTLGGAFGIDAKVFPEDSKGNFLQFSPGVHYEERPTITYVPLQGSAYVQRLLTPISLDLLFTLVQSGWSIDRVFNVCVQRLNAVKNAPTASGPTPTCVPEYLEFDKLSCNFRKLQQANLIDLGEDHDPTTLRAIIKPKDKTFFFLFEDDPDYASILDETYQMLNISRENKQLELTFNVLKEKRDDRIKIMNRTLMGVLFYLSQAINVPQEHTQAGFVSRTCWPNGEPFNWDCLSGKYLKVYSQKKEPACGVKVCYRGHWFYIRDNDLNSKATFMLLSALFSIQTDSGGSSSTPQLTIPVNG